LLNKSILSCTLPETSNSDIKRWRKNSEAIATPLKTDSELDSEIIALREDKIIEDEIREKNIIIIDNTLFSNECKISEQWIETIAMQSKIKIDVVKIFLDTFESHLITMQEQKKTLKDFKEHFSHWIKKTKHFKF